MNNCIYITYDKNLKEYLRKYGIENILYGLHPKTLKMFWVYKRDSVLQEKLDFWFNKNV